MKRSGVVIGLGAILLVFLAYGAFVAVKSYGDWRALQKSDPTYSARELSDQAAELQKSGDYASAERSYRESLAKNYTLDAQLQLAVVLYQLKRYEVAVSTYKEAIEKGAEKGFAWNGIGNSLRDAADADPQNRVQYLQDAEAAYREAILAEPRYVAAYSNLALLLKEQGRIDEAKATLQAGVDSTGQSSLQELLSRI